MEKEPNYQPPEDLLKFLRIPTVSAMSEHAEDMQKAAQQLVEKFKSLGFEASLLLSEGHPAVFAQSYKTTGEDAPIVAVYGHYDVQDVGEISDWQSDPFSPTEMNGNLVGRGTADDKCQFWTWIHAAEELLKDNGKLPVNMKFLIEGEEELASKNLPEILQRAKDLLKADIWVVSDSHSLSENEPVLTYGLRGIVYLQLDLKTLAKDAHSGTYGGNAPNAANILVEMLSSLKDPDTQRIEIPGFYDDVREVSDEERERLNKFPFDEKAIKRETGAKFVRGEEEFTPQERAGMRPTLDINGIWGGYQGEGPKTIIPAVASAKFSMRLVPDQKSKSVLEQVTNYLKSITPEGADLTITSLGTGEPFLVDTRSKYFAKARLAMTRAFGNQPLEAMEGGSIPVTGLIKTIFGKDTLLMGYGLPDDGLHAPNEKFSLKMYDNGVRTNIHFLKLLAQE